MCRFFFAIINLLLHLVLISPKENLKPIRMNFLFIIVIITLIIILLATLRYNAYYRNLEERVKVKAQQQADLPAREFSIDFLEQKRARKDTLADAVIAEVMDHNEREEINLLFGMLMANKHEKIDPKIHPAIRNYFETTAILPEWADKDLIEFGQENFIRHGLLVGMLLFYKSLPECYTGAKGAEVLLMSGKLSENSTGDERFSKRMAETGLFVFNVMSPGGLEDSGKGIVTAQKVRLLHATIRFFIMKSGRWDTSKLDEPINQEDMAGTLISFSGLILEGLEFIGVKLDSHEAEAYVHCWSVVGHIMGLDEDLIPRNVKEALALGHKVIDHQKGQSVAGQELTKALLNFCNRKGPKLLGMDYHISMIRMLIGSGYSEMLGLADIPQEKLDYYKRNVMRYVSFREFLEHRGLLSLVVLTIDKIVLKMSVSYLSKNNLMHFFLPKSFKMD